MVAATLVVARVRLQVAVVQHNIPESVGKRSKNGRKQRKSIEIAPAGRRYPGRIPLRRCSCRETLISDTHGSFFSQKEYTDRPISQRIHALLDRCPYPAFPSASTRASAPAHNPSETRRRTVVGIGPFQNSSFYMQISSVSREEIRHL